MSEPNDQKEREGKPKVSKKPLQGVKSSLKDHSSNASSNNSKQHAEDGSKHSRSRQAPKLSIFDHLPSRGVDRSPRLRSDDSIHPAIVKLGALYQTGMIQDDDDRAYALLVAFHNVIMDYTTPPNKNLSWDLDKHVKVQVSSNNLRINCQVNICIVSASS